MMYVKSKLGKSKISGIGVFADQAIKKGAIVWKFTPGFDIEFTDKQISKLPKMARKYIDTYSFLGKKSKKNILPLDNAKYFNHSNRPNCLSKHYPNEREVVTKAIRNIKKGEELTDNYATFEADFDSSNL